MQTAFLQLKRNILKNDKLQPYIALDEYFSYLKIERINELQMIAKSLGAKHFKVTYKEEQTAFSEKSSKEKQV